MNHKEKQGIKKRIDKFYKVTESGSSFKIEIIAGIATFLAMAYILTVNPNNILYATGTSDARWSSIFIATAFGGVMGTLLMSLLAKMPLAQAPGLGLNSTVGGLIGGGAIGATAGASMSLGTALLLVLISGVVFLFISIVPGGKDKETGKWISIREKVFDGVPASIRLAIPVGIGLFIAFIGFKNAGIIVDNPHTFISLVDFSNKANYSNGGVASQAIVCLFGFFVIGILSHYKMKGSVIIGILAATLLALPLKVADIDILLGKSNGITWAFWRNFQNFFSMKPQEGGVFLAVFTEGFKGLKDVNITLGIVTIISFCMIEMFDTMGTVVGCCANANLLDETGKPLNYNKIMYSDSISTVAGALVGTSTVTTFVESGVGIATGGRTGLTSLTTAILFLLAIFILPIFAFIPAAAASSALIYVGVLMMGNVKKIDFSNIKNAIPAFLAIICMPLCYSITDGIGIAFIAYVVIYIIIFLADLLKAFITKKEKPKWELSIVNIVIFALFMFYFLDDILIGIFV